MSTDKKNTSDNKRLALNLIIVVAAGLAFGFAIAPLYDAVCKAFGLNGRGDTTATELTAGIKVDKSRTIKVTFTGTTMPGLNWEFEPNQTSMTVHPGEITLTSYTAKNNGKEPIAGTAVPSTVPEVAAKYFKKVECFCFTNQTLQAGEEKEMPVRYFISSDLPKEIHSVTLAYSFFNAEDRADKLAEED